MLRSLRRLREVEVCVVLPSAIVRLTDDLAPIVLFSDDLVPFSDGIAIIVL